MGNVLTNFNDKNPCLSKEEEPETVPRYHFKCRYDDKDQLTPTQVYTRTTDVLRFKVPRDKIKWSVEFDDYEPTEFTSAKILKQDGAVYKDPHINEPKYFDITFNTIDQVYKCDRRSLHGPYQFIEYLDKEVLVPCNPVGRTGLVGRGHLGRWGPNHAADPIVTRWKRNPTNKKKVNNERTGKPILEFISIQRKDTQEWALPGGMRDPGEKYSLTLVRELNEEALNNDLQFDKFNRIVSKSNPEFGRRLDEFFKGGTQIYRGYVDDPRNTDNSWMETIACNFHDEEGNLVGTFELKGGDDAEKARWAEVSSDLKLFASHVDFLRDVAKLRDAHW